MVKLFKPLCECTICRSTPLPLHTSPATSTASYSPPTALAPIFKATATPSNTPVTQGSRIASTSQIPYSTPLAICLPTELLLEIFHLARPPVIRRKRGWYARLCLVHSRWKEAAQECLVKVAILTKSAQISRLETSVKKGWAGGKIEEIVLDLREMSSGKINLKVVSALSRSLTALFLAASSYDTSQSSSLKVLRLVGFGIDLVQKLPITLFPSLDNLTTFEYSPIDSSYPPTSEGLLRLLSHAPRLESLILQPSNHAIIHIEDPETPNRVVTQIASALPLMAALDTLFSNRPALAEEAAALRRLLSVLRDTPSFGSAQLKTLSLSSLCFSTSLFLELVVHSFKTITSLSFRSIIITGGPNDSIELFTALAYLVDGLLEFTREDAIISVIGLDHSLLPVEKFWNFLSSCKKLRKLNLFSPILFAPLPSSTPQPISSPPLGSTPPTIPVTQSPRANFSLPPDLESLSIATVRVDVGAEELGWWIDKVADLVHGKTTHSSTGSEAVDQDDEDYSASLISLFDSSPLSPSIPSPTRSSSFTTLEIALPFASHPIAHHESIRSKLSRIPTTQIRGQWKRVKVAWKWMQVVSIDELEMTRELRMEM